MRSLVRTIFISLLWLAGADQWISAQTANGWRGNGTGLWPDADPPQTWQHLPRGAVENLRACAAKPKQDATNEPLIEKGLIRDWLVIGPFEVEDSTKNFNQDFLNGESTIQPTVDDQVGGHTWKSWTTPTDDVMVFGTAEMPWLDLAKAVGAKKNQIGYAHTYLHSPRGGPARIVIDHGHGLKLWVNGKEVYQHAQQATGLGFYTGLSRIELSHSDQTSPKIDVELKAGWNRLLVKLSSANLPDSSTMRASLRISDPPTVKYDSKNMVWMTPLPGRSTSTPIQVGDRLLVMAEPDELVCIDKRDGKIQWSALVNYYSALTTEEKAKHPDYAKKIDPLIAELKAEKEPRKRLRLRATIQKALLELDANRFRVAADGHFESHFGIVGFTMPTPVSDGKHVYVWSGLGVAACFDLDGKQRWITRIPTDHLSYGSSPALADGVLAVFLNSLYGLDANTGKIVWTQPKVRYNVASILAATLGGKNVFVTQRGDVIHPANGEFLLRQRDSSAPGDTGWSPPTILGNHVYLPKYGVTHTSLLDFTEVTGDTWEPKLLAKLEMPSEVSRLNGKWIDRWTAGSPLIYDGLVYQTDIYQTLYVSEVKSRKLLYRQELPLAGFTHYNAVAVAASPTLLGKHICILDNQGTALLLAPGPKYQLVARNRIATQLDRPFPIPAQETLAYAPPIADGKRIYLRGERFLYCIGEK